MSMTNLSDRDKVMIAMCAACLMNVGWDERFDMHVSDWHDVYKMFVDKLEFDWEDEEMTKLEQAMMKWANERIA